jgi:catalase
MILALLAALASACVAHAADDAATADPAAPQKPLPVALVDALNALAHGPHAGFRANHAKGVLVEGTFLPAPGAAAFSKAAHFAHPVPVLVRFSDTTGVPNIPDADPNASPHGIAIRFTLPTGAFTDIVSISANGFPVATPEDFLAFLQAAAQSGPEAAKPTPVEKFLATHPAAVTFVTTSRPPPVSFGTLTFYGVDAFKFTNAKGVSHYARYQIVPVSGQQSLSDADAKTADANYLMDELPQRLARGAIKFHLVAQVAQHGDSVVDPTSVWPADRKQVLLGTLVLRKLSENQAAAQKAIMFSPLNLLAGIEPSADPILLARPSAYGVSFSQRIR